MKIPHFGLQRQYKNLKDELLDATDRALSTGQLVSGKYTKEFESWLAVKTKTKYAITVHSGSQALEIIARHKLAWHYTDNKHVPIIKLPNLTYPATLNAFINTGWKVELVDTEHNIGCVLTEMLVLEWQLVLTLQKIYQVQATAVLL